MLALLATLLLAPQVAPPAAAPPSSFDHGHAAWTVLLRAHVEPTGVDYAGFEQDRPALEAYLRTLEAVTPAQLAAFTREQRLAFWIDAYNAYTVHLVASKHPVPSIRNLGTLFEKVWDKDFVPLGHLAPEQAGKRLSLSEIEELILRPRFEDARVHAALHRAARSGPALRPEAYVAERLAEQLDEAARAWLRDPNLNRFDRTATTVFLSELFRWHAADFARDAGSVQAWVARFAPADEASWIGRARRLEVRYLEFDWSLDAARR